MTLEWKNFEHISQGRAHEELWLIIINVLCKLSCACAGGQDSGA